MSKKPGTGKQIKTAALVAPEQARPASVLARLAGRFGVEQGKMLECLKATAFRGEVSNEQMMALCVVADQYKLNPWTKEIYAFLDKNNGIVPVVGVDGWSRIINEHPQFDGVELVDADDGASCTCTIYRKDRQHATSVTEYLSECKRGTSPWTSHPRRMLRHKALIQCARIAFGYAGIYDQDEAERILEGVEVGPARTPVEMPRLLTPTVKDEPAAAGAEPSEEQGEPSEPTQRDEIIEQIKALIEATKASKVDKAMKSVGIGWQEGEDWEQQDDEKLRSLLSLLRKES